MIAGKSLQLLFNTEQRAFIFANKKILLRNRKMYPGKGYCWQFFFV